jgi:virginiamycin B lyase
VHDHTAPATGDTRAREPILLHLRWVSWPGRVTGLLVGLALALLAGAGLASAQTITEFAIPGANSNPVGITTGSDGNLWFTEAGSSQLGRITTAGTITEFVLAAGREPFGIVSGPDNNLWFAEAGGDRIGRINPNAGSDAAIQASLVEFVVPGVGSQPFGITAGPDGAL